MGKARNLTSTFSMGYTYTLTLPIDSKFIDFHTLKQEGKTTYIECRLRGRNFAFYLFINLIPPTQVKVPLVLGKYKGNYPHSSNTFLQGVV